MSTIRIHFEWSRGHAYGWAAPREGGAWMLLPTDASVPPSPLICQRGKGRERYRPLEIHESLYLDFAALDGSPEACLGFAQRWGLLTRHAAPGAAEPVSEWRKQI